MLHKIVDACHLRRDVDLLGAVFHTFLASDTVIGLAELGNAPVVAYEECATGFAIILGLGVFRNVALVDTFVVVQKHTGYIQAVGAGHTVLTRHTIVLHQGLVGVGQTVADRFDPT